MKGKSPKGSRVQAKRSFKGAEAASKRASLLVVEDHRPTRIALQKLLESRDFKVKCAATVAEAWALAGEHSFDLMISDIGLPDGDGYLLMSELRALHNMRGIALSGFGMEDDFRLSEEAGFSAHIVKPITAELLDETLAKLGL
jgi:CheY-like chemotaxis protein